jgi:hypothetical protein
MKNKTFEPDAVCGFWNKPIFLKNEVYHTLFTSRGTPICAVCRVMRKPPKKLLKVVVDREAKEQKKADEQLLDIAIKSQEEAKEFEKNPKKKKFALNKKHYGDKSRKVSKRKRKK